MTLSTDIGSAYAAQMKAVLSRSIEPGRVVDLSHELPAHAIREAAFLIRAMARGFPAGTVHVVVVDPGVGGRRAPIAIACRDGSAVVGPDNGVLYPLAEALGLGPTFRLEPGRWPTAPARVGRTFDGRDLFAPAAALLADGTLPSRLGRPVAPAPLRLDDARRTATGAVGEVVHVDHFGNVISNVPSDWVPPAVDRIRVRFGRGPARSLPWAPSYEALGAGRSGALGSSFGTIELAVARGRAADRFRVRTGSSVRFGWPACHSESSG